MFIKTLVSHPYITTILELPTLDLLLAAGALFAVIKIFVILYRLSPLHPLAKVPGPRIAAATWWYRVYYEALPQGGLMHDKIKRMHEKYGPVVRISPNDVHFASPSAYLHIYSTASKTVKDPYHYKCFNEDLSSFGFCDPVTARQRRDLLHPFFSRRNILHMHHAIEDKLCLLTHQLRIMSKCPEKPEGEPVDMSLAAKSFTMDVIMEFCFARTLDILRAPAFGHSLLGGTEKALPMFYVFKHFTTVKHIILNMPNWLALWLTPDSSKGVLLLQNVLGDQLDQFLKDPEGMAEGVEHEVIYHRLLGVGKFGDKGENGETIPRQNIGRKSLYHEAQALLFAGSDTVGNTIAVGTFHILRTPGVVDRLIQELRTVWPGDPWVGMPRVGEEYKDGSGKLPVGWETFEKLPYLGAVIKESLRLSHGCVSPLARLAPAQGVTVDGWTFPAGTGIASSAPSVHLDPSVFPDPHTFRPERWLGPNAVELERYLVPFSKGPRQCLGINLAWCELYLTFATLYRRFEFENFETKPEDLEYRDFLIPVLNGRIKVLAKPRVD